MTLLDRSVREDAALDPGKVPIQTGFYPDPTICRVGDEYFMAHSSFEYFPGVPIFRSTDLMTWDQIGHVLDRRTQFRFGSGGPSRGLYAGTLRHHDGRFWYVTTNISDFRAGQLLVTAEHPEGPWSEPVFFERAVGIDPDICWDDDGTCFLTWKAMDFGDGDTGIRQAVVDTDTGRFRTEPIAIWQGTGLNAAEGPHLYPVDGEWHLLLAEGGTERGHAVTAARGPTPSGPFEAHPANPILSHRSLDHPVQNVGHADLVQLVDGSWAAVYLGARPRGSTPGFHVLGRETFLAEVDWEDGWPTFRPWPRHLPPTDSSFEERFASPALHHRWVAPDADPSALATPHPDGGISLAAGPEGTVAPLCFRVRDDLWRAEATVAGAAAVFEVRIDDRHRYSIVADRDEVRAEVRIGDVVAVIDAVPRPLDRITVSIAAVRPRTGTVPLGHAGPDDVVLSLVTSFGTHELARLDGRYLSTEVASGFTGRMIAIAAVDAPIRVEHVTYSRTR